MHLSRPLSKREKFRRDFVWVPEKSAVMSRSGSIIIPRSTKITASIKRLYDPSFRQAELQRMKKALGQRLQQRKQEQASDAVHSPFALQLETRRGAYSTSVGGMYSSFADASQRQDSATFGSPTSPLFRQAFAPPQPDPPPQRRPLVNYLQMQMAAREDKRKAKEQHKEEMRKRREQLILEEIAEEDRRKAAEHARLQEEQARTIALEKRIEEEEIRLARVKEAQRQKAMAIKAANIKAEQDAQYREKHRDSLVKKLKTKQNKLRSMIDA